MRSYQQVNSRVGRQIPLDAESLENRTLLNGSPASQQLAIQVPSNYVSQQAEQVNVTLTRSRASGGARNLGPLTVDFSASNAPPAPAGVASVTPATPQFTPVNEAVTFPPGVTTETVSVPINSGAANPGLVPVNLTVTGSSRGVRGSNQVIYLANSEDAIPPSITSVARVAGGIAITFSKPMDPSTVGNIHNYAVKFSPSQKFGLEQLTGFGLIETMKPAHQAIPLRRATYDSATNTVTLVATEQLGLNGSYTISNPASLTSRARPSKKAHALLDSAGSALEEGHGGGIFSITISKGHPYSAKAPVLSDGS